MAIDFEEDSPVWATTFADPGDVERYRRAKARGLSDQEAFKVGDNGIGKWGDDTTRLDDPIVALPRDLPGVKHNRRVEVTGPDGRTVVARVADVMPKRANIKNGAGIDLNPAAAAAIGATSGKVPVNYRFIDTPEVSGAKGPAIDFEEDPAAVIDFEPEESPTPVSGFLASNSNPPEASQIGAQIDQSLATTILRPLGIGLETAPKAMMQTVDYLNQYFYKPVDAAFGSKLSEQFTARIAQRQGEIDAARAEAQRIGGANYGAIASGIGEQIPQIPIQLATAGAAGWARGIQAAIKASAAIGALQSAGSSYGSNVAHRVQAGQSLDQAAEAELLPSISSGLITGATTLAFGGTGLESVFAKAGARGAVGKLVETLKQAGFEIAEEETDEITQMASDLVHNKKITPDEALQRVGQVAVISGILGGGVAGLHQALAAAPASPDARTEPAAEPALERLEDLPVMTRSALDASLRGAGLAPEEISAIITVPQAMEILSERRRAKAEIEFQSQETRKEEAPAEAVTGEAAPLSGFVDSKLNPSPEPTPEQIAQQQYEAELLAEAEAAQSGNALELTDAIIEAGGLPSKKSPARETYASEIERIESAVRNPQRTEKLAPNQLFRDDAPDLDELATRLRDRGFEINDPAELLDLAEQRFRTGKARYGSAAPVTEEQMAYATKKAKPLVLKNLADLPGLKQPALATPAQATLPRRITTSVMPTSSQPGVLRSLADIRKTLSTALDIPVRLGVRAPGGIRGAVGLYRVKPQTIRMKALNDIPTLAHEIGHDLHHIVFMNPATGAPQRWAHAYDAELLPLGQKTSGANYSTDQVRMEGVAEFAREWLTDRANAIAHAPAFAAHFETTLRKEHPEIHAIIEQARKDVEAYIAAPGWEKAKSMIRWNAPDVRTPLRDRLERIYTHWFDELRPLNRMMNKLVELGLDRRTASEVSARAVNYKGGWRGKADHDLRFELTDLNGKRRGKSLHEILAGLEDLRDWDTYIALKRAQEKQAQGFTTGFEDALADPDTHRKLRDLAPLYEARRQDLIKFSDGLMANMEQSGYFTPAQMTAMRSANRDYVPFHRIYETVTGESIGPAGGGSGFVNTSSGVRRFKGSDLQISSPTEAMIKNTYLFRDLAERNRIARTFVDAVDATTGGGRVAESVLKPMKPTNVSHEEMIAKLRDVGLGAEADKLSKAGVDFAHTIFRAADGVNAKEGTFRIWRDGQEKLYQVGDAELLRAITLADTQDAMLIQRMPGFKVAAWITGKLRAGATLSPEFIVRNAMRDPITAAVFSRNGFVPLYDTARGIFSALRNDHWYRDWMKSGASHSGLYDSSARNVEAALREMITEPSALRTALDLINPLNVIANLNKASSIIEQGTRVSEFRRAIANGKDPLEAANDAKDVTLNFSRYGYKGKVINQIAAFFNAGLQDVDKIVRAHRTAPTQTALKAFLYITAPSIAVWFLGKDDEEIQQLPEWRRSLFWNVNLGEFVLSLPKPFLLGAIYGTTAEKALDWAYDKDPNAIRKLGLALAQNTFIKDDLVVVSTALKPTIENIANYSFFTGRPLVSEGQRDLEKRLQFNPQTSEVAKIIGPALGTSPIYIDNLVRGHLGNLGTLGTDAIDWFLVKTSLVSAATTPSKSWRELPGARAFFGSPYAANEYVPRFYKAMDEAERRQKSFNAYGQRMLNAEQEKFWRKNQNEIVWYNAATGENATVMTELRRARTAMADIGKAMAMVQNDRTLAADLKRQRLLALKEARDQMAESAFRAYVHPTDRFKVY